MKLTERQAKFCFNLTVSIVMSVCMSFGMIFLEKGWFNGFLYTWLQSSLIGTVLSLPLTFTIIPFLRKKIIG